MTAEKGQEKETDGIMSGAQGFREKIKNPSLIGEFLILGNGLVSKLCKEFIHSFFFIPVSTHKLLLWGTTPRHWLN